MMIMMIKCEFNCYESIIIFRVIDLCWIVGTPCGVNENATQIFLASPQLKVKGVTGKWLYGLQNVGKNARWRIGGERV